MLLFDTVPLPQYFTNLFNRDVEHEELNPLYRCARGAFHVLNVAKAFLILEILAIPIYVMFLFPYWIMWIGIHALIILVTIYALKRERQRFLWPFVIYAAIQFFCWTILAVVKFILGIFSTQYFLELYGQGHHEDFFTRIMIVVAIKTIVLLIGAVLFWRLAVFHTTRKYFEAKTDGDPQIAAVDPEQATGIEKLMQPI